MSIYVPKVRAEGRLRGYVESLGMRIHFPYEGPTGFLNYSTSLQRQGLTEEQIGVVQLAVLGLSTEDIAYQLFMAPLTVTKHLSSAYRALKINGKNGNNARIKLAKLLLYKEVEADLLPSYKPLQLTPLRRKLLQLVADGLSDTKIADICGISVNTVKKTVGYIKDSISGQKKVNVPNRVILAIHGLLETLYQEHFVIAETPSS